MIICLIFLLLIQLVIPSQSSLSHNATLSGEECKWLVIAHRGASGYVPEHTLGSYALAIMMGADYIEPDIIITRDGHLVARHYNELSSTTDVAEHPEFAERYLNKTVDGIQMTGWFSEDFTLAEIKTLRAIERIPGQRPGNARMNGIFTIPTFQEIISLVKSLEISEKRVIGIYPEIKHSTYFKRLGLPVEGELLSTLTRNNYRRATDPVIIQSFEITNLKDLKTKTDLRLMQLLNREFLQPFDQAEIDNKINYKNMATAEGLREISKYASVVGPNKLYIIPRDINNQLGSATSFVEDAHALGLKVHAHTFQRENAFLPKEYQNQDGAPESFGDLMSEIQAYISTGIDGLFIDQPDIGVKVRGACLPDNNENVISYS